MVITYENTSAILSLGLKLEKQLSNLTYHTNGINSEIWSWIRRLMEQMYCFTPIV